MSKQIEELRALICDESKPLPARKDAAAHLVRLRVADVVDVPDDDEDVVELMTPWSDKETAEMWSETTGGRSINGWSLPDAKAVVTRRHRERVLLTTVLDESLPRLVRLAAVQSVLDSSHPGSHWRVNHYTAERLLDMILPPDAKKWTSAGKVQVSRPPMDAGDVWP